jgi:CHASE3 domain sensor protein
MRVAISQRLSVVGFALSCAILAVIGASSYHRLGELRTASRAVERTHEVRTELERIRSLLTDAETGQRGFLLTGSVSYLEPYSAALASLPAVSNGFGSLRPTTRSSRQISPPWTC